MSENVLGSIRDIVVTEGRKQGRISEAFLSEKLGMSRTPVREALKHLEEEDLIERRQGFGISLKTPSPRELIEIYDIRILLEGLACRYLADNLNGPVLLELKKASTEYNRIKRNRDDLKLRAADAAFHQVLLANCGSRRLVRFVGNLRIITNSFKMVNNVPARISFQEVKYPHEKVIAALESGSPVKAEETMRLHIQEGKNTFLKFFLGPGIKSY